MDQRGDAETLRRGVRERYRDVALNPDRSLGSYTGRPLATKLRYPSAIVDALPNRAVESFAGVSSPFSLRELNRGERVLDIGSGAGFNTFVAAGWVGHGGRVVGVDMTPEMVCPGPRRRTRPGSCRVPRRPGRKPPSRRRLA